MNQREKKRKISPPEGVPVKPSPKEAKQLEEDIEARERAQDGKLRRWKEKVLMSPFLLATLVLCIAWAVVFLSGQFSPEDKKQVTALFDKLIFALLGVLAGKGMKS